MSNFPTRRTFLAGTGTGTIAALAGCSGLESLTQDGSGTAEAVTVTVQPDREALTSLQEEIRGSLESGEISQREAQQRFREGQRDLTEEAATPLEELAEREDAVSIEASDASYSFFLVDAPAETLVAALRDGDVSAIYPRDRYDQFAQQRDRIEQQQPPAGGQGDANGSTAEPNGSIDGDANGSSDGT